MNSVTEAAVTILVGLTGLAMLAIIISKKSNTAGVIGAVFSGYSQALGTAISPIVGGGGSFGGISLGLSPSDFSVSHY